MDNQVAPTPNTAVAHIDLRPIEARIMEICAAGDDVYALDGRGNIWVRAINMLADNTYQFYWQLVPLNTVPLTREELKNVKPS